MPDAMDGWTCAAGCASRSAARADMLPRVMCDRPRCTHCRRAGGRHVFDLMSISRCAALSRHLFRNHYTDCPVLARVAGSITILTGIDR